MNDINKKVVEKYKRNLGHIDLKVKNVQSTRKAPNNREEPFLEHVKRTQCEWDVWMLTETWRPEESECFDMAESVSTKRHSLYV